VELGIALVKRGDLGIALVEMEPPGVALVELGLLGVALVEMAVALVDGLCAPTVAQPTLTRGANSIGSVQILLEEGARKGEGGGGLMQSEFVPPPLLAQMRNPLTCTS